MVARRAGLDPPRPRQIAGDDAAQGLRPMQPRRGARANRAARRRASARRRRAPARSRRAASPRRRSAPVRSARSRGCRRAASDRAICGVCNGRPSPRLVPPATSSTGSSAASAAPTASRNSSIDRRDKPGHRMRLNACYCEACKRRCRDVCDPWKLPVRRRASSRLSARCCGRSIAIARCAASSKAPRFAAAPASARADFKWLQGEELVNYYEVNARAIAAASAASAARRSSTAPSRIQTGGTTHPQTLCEFGIALGTLDDDPGVRPESSHLRRQQGALVRDHRRSAAIPETTAAAASLEPRQIGDAAARRRGRAAGPVRRSGAAAGNTLPGLSSPSGSKAHLRRS